MGALEAVRGPGAALRRERAVVCGMMIPHKEDGGGVLLPDKLKAVLYGFIRFMAGHGTVDKVIEHIHNDECSVFHGSTFDKDTQKMLYLYDVQAM
jgi:hypothetical protein